MDGLWSHQTVPNIFYASIFPERSIALVKRLAGSPKGLKLIVPHANKVLLQGSTFLYMDGLQSHKLCPSRCYLTASSIFPRSIALVNDWLVHQKGWNWSQPAHAKGDSRCTRILIYMMDFFQSRKLCPSRCYLTFFHIRTFNCTSKTLAGSPKELKWSQPALTVLLKVAHSAMDGLLSIASNCCRCYLTFFHIPERSIGLVKDDWLVHQGLKLIPTCPR
jgi:hypothetical protein